MPIAAFEYENGTLLKIYGYLHPGLLQRFYNECRENPRLMQLEPNYLKGTVYTCIGIIYEFLYILCMIAMCQPRFLRIVCYRILFVIGCFDLLGMIPNSLLPGYLLLTGKSFCQSPLLNLYIGSMAFPTWAVYSGLSLSLAINRWIDFTFANMQEEGRFVFREFFGGKKIIIWTGLPALYGLFWYLRLDPMLYHAPTASYYFGAEPTRAKAPLIYPINNGFVAAVIMVLNIMMIWAMIKRNYETMTKSQRVIMIQCLGISMSVLITGWLYVAMQFLPMPLFMITVANTCWQFSNGSMAIFYLLVNKSMRGEVYKLLRIPFRRSTIYTTSITDGKSTTITNPQNDHK